MSNRTLEVMQEHLQIAEKYISELKKAESKEEFLNAMRRCIKSVHEQYPALEEISDDYAEKIGKADKELKEISVRVGDIYGKQVTSLYGKMGAYMADKDFMEVLSTLDKVIGNNPLFGVSEFGEEVARQVSESIAGSLNEVAAKIMADSTETDEVVLADITSLMDEFCSLSKRYVMKLAESNTARKIVTATDSYVSGIKKMIPEMKRNADQLKLIMSRNEKPEELIKLSEELKKTLGDDLKAVMKDKDEIFSDQKVQKSVSKLGTVLSDVPF